MVEILCEKLDEVRKEAPIVVKEFEQDFVDN